jgi:cytochrome c biogenesis protein CcdA/thiol-disulfide isomerase/thioredoxin
MALLLVIGFLAGVITAISPCVLPVLPILLAGGATGGRRKPYAIIAGLVVSFVVFTLGATWLLDALGLPKDVLRNVALAFLFVVAATLLVPRLGELLERPFLPLTRRSGGDLGGGLLLGVSLGLVFVPCSGPVLAYVITRAASEEVNAKSVLLIAAYALGAAVPMLIVAIGGRQAATAFRTRALRPALGAVLALAAVGIALDLDVRAQTALGGYTNRLQGWIEGNGFAERQLAGRRSSSGAGLDDFGPAPAFRGLSDWINTSGDRPLTLAGLRGKVVLVDFWTYSCINCIRTLPHLKAWDAAYRNDGLVIVGVHTPEFAFEHEPDNVRSAVRRFGIRYPVALDNDYGTWNAYSNQYWPADYLVDRTGLIRHVHFGEGDYGGTRRLIQRLLGTKAGSRAVPDRTPLEQTTPETYLGWQRLVNYAGSQIAQGRGHQYRFPASLPPDNVAYGGRWTVEPERILSGADARLRLRFRARNVFLVLGGRGRVDVLVDGNREGRVRVAGYRLYTLLSGRDAREGLLELRFSPGLRAYAFTFG